MIHAGLLSITFRSLSPRDVVRAAQEAGLSGIEWGGDVHVPLGNLSAAREVAAMTRAAGLRVSAYGSYHRLGSQPADGGAGLIETVVALGAPLVRVWAGNKGSASATDEERQIIAADARCLCTLAASAGVRVATEWHGGTLTDTATSARAFFDAVDHPNLFTYWQPHQRTQPRACVQDLETAFPRLAGLHVFQWHVETAERQPLEAGESCWPIYLARANQRGEDFFASLEFVLNDSVDQMKRDAAVLRRWLGTLS